MLLLETMILRLKMKKKVKAILRIVVLPLVQHVNACGLSGDAETRGVLCSCCDSGAELQPRCIWFLLDTIHNSKFIRVQDSTSYSVKLLLLVLFLFIRVLFFFFCFVCLWVFFVFFPLLFFRWDPASES